MNFLNFAANLRPEIESGNQDWEKENSFVSEPVFHNMISRERKRTERSRKPFLLVLLDTGTNLSAPANRKLLAKIGSGCLAYTRETDTKGWYKKDYVIGVMFTETAVDTQISLVSTMLRRMSEILEKCLHPEQANQVSISLHLYPEDWQFDLQNRASNPNFYPDLQQRENSQRFFRSVKRAIDIVGSAIALILAFPLFVVIAATIKLTSPGPILFRQKRVGQYGVAFTFLKFRSMYIDNDTSVHKEWFRRFRTGVEQRHQTNNKGDGSYKIPHDPRVTAVGRLLRRTSMDELPQFINVLIGNMSLVGPRPPIAYEVETYEPWHRRRVLEAKPGITGLWQVNGRSRVTFEEMVRLDIRYARSCSLWLDFKILLHTPAAVLLGEGAY